jgi:hypothetical protein
MSNFETKRKDDEGDSDGYISLMVNGDEAEQEEAPLHDMTCVGIDTCSTKSISCLKEDFF